MEKRTDCRKYYKELRNAMPAEAVSENSKLICRRILTSDWYRSATFLFGYYPLGNEMNCLPVLEQALLDGKRVALPKTGKESTMEFYEIHSLTEDVAEGAFHIMEPKADCNLVRLSGRKSADSPEDANSIFLQEVLVLVPGVVFDREGNRYGYGRGFYDRYFARFPELFRMALAYDIQMADESLSCLDTDVKMHMIVTETECIGNEKCK